MTEQTQEKAYEHFSGRTELLVGPEGVARLAAAKVFVFGLGGVGAYAVEALARAGVGTLVLVDFDTVAPSNLNRQLIALHSTLGQEKARVIEARIRDIRPETQVVRVQAFADPDNIDSILGDAPAFVVDAIDSVYAKVALLAAAHRRGWPVVSCMGAANRLSPLGIRVADIANTRYCPLARAIRERLRKRGIVTGVRCVYSHENRERVHEHATVEGHRKKRIQGSISYVPGIVGLTAAGVIVNDILGHPVPLER